MLSALVGYMLSYLALEAVVTTMSEIVVVVAVAISLTLAAVGICIVVRPWVARRAAPFVIGALAGFCVAAAAIGLVLFAVGGIDASIS